MIRVKQQKNVPYVNKPELELTELLHLRAGAEGGPDRGTGWVRVGLDHMSC